VPLPVSRVAFLIGYQGRSSAEFLGALERARITMSLSYTTLGGSAAGRQQ